MFKVMVTTYMAVYGESDKPSSTSVAVLSFDTKSDACEALLKINTEDAVGKDNHLWLAGTKYAVRQVARLAF